MIAADYIDRLACPCGFPARRIGRWYIERGEWRFEAQRVSAKRPRHERPEYDGQRWENHPRTVVTTDYRSGAESRKSVEEWHYVVEFECMGDIFDPERTEEHGALQRCDCKPYTGPEHEWMQAPTDPEWRPVTLPDFTDRKTLAGGNT